MPTTTDSSCGSFTACCSCSSRRIANSCIRLCRRTTQMAMRLAGQGRSTGTTTRRPASAISRLALVGRDTPTFGVVYASRWGCCTSPAALTSPYRHWGRSSGTRRTSMRSLTQTYPTGICSTRYTRSRSSPTTRRSGGSTIGTSRRRSLVPFTRPCWSCIPKCRSTRPRRRGRSGVVEETPAASGKRPAPTTRRTASCNGC